jgi:hypothetical protein
MPEPARILLLAALLVTTAGACSEAPPPSDLDAVIVPGAGPGGSGGSPPGGTITPPDAGTTPDALGPLDPDATPDPDTPQADAALTAVEETRRRAIERAVADAVRSCPAWCERTLLCLSPTPLDDCLRACQGDLQRVLRSTDATVAAQRCAEAVRDLLACAPRFECEDWFFLQEGRFTACVPQAGAVADSCTRFGISGRQLLLP